MNALSAGGRLNLAGATIMALGIAVAPVRAAEPVMLSAMEISEMMTGNSLSGVFPDGVTFYRQNNHSDGIMTIHIQNDRLYNIPWRVLDEAGVGRYCEDWSAVDWGEMCYAVTRQDPLMPVYVSSEGKLIPADWSEGFIDLNFAK